MRAFPVLLALAMLGCREKVPDPVDNDGDGVTSELDCNDDDPNAFPDNVEACDGIDNDCDAEIDEAGATGELTWYGDADRDGYGETAVTAIGCVAPDGYAAQGGDCDDFAPEFYPGAAEEDCTDPNDYNCDGSVGYADVDGDGYAACQDCDDAERTTNPNSLEVCDGVDNNCDGTADESGAFGEETFYADADGDGFGDASTALDACAAPEGYVADRTDCDDLAATSFPGATETCDGVDQNCNGVADEGATDLQTWYLDTDGDGSGDASSSLQACTPPSKYVASDDDCDDRNPNTHPGADEVCDTYDNDCDLEVDEDAVALAVWYLDADSDGYGDETATQESCEPPDGYVSGKGDCDDVNPDVNPLALEACNFGDDDCDGEVDEEATDALTFYRDSDADGAGDKGDTVEACLAPDGYVSDAKDCNDADGTIYPDASEFCNDKDDDCDGAKDEDAIDAKTFYLDADKDGAGGDSITQTGCKAPTGYLETSEDCDDLNPNTYPGADEICDTLDNDCDGTVDEDAAKPATWYKDADNDGYGVASSTLDQCSKPTGYVATPGDCDDTRNTVYPNADETCNGRDDDCNSAIDDNPSDAKTFFADVDGDTYGDPDAKKFACTAPGGYVADNTDCNDKDATVYPKAPETCDGVDDDCNGLKDDNPVDPKTWYKDGDNDGYGLDSTTQKACAKPSGYVDKGGDCNDLKSAVRPGATELWYDGVDQDCDGGSDYDQDGDGKESWQQIGGSDCDDLDPSTWKCGSTAALPGESCLQILQSGAASGNAEYWISPPGNTVPAFKAWCLMDTAYDGGGYTLLKATPGGVVKAPAAETWCAARGMQLFIPRTEVHLKGAWSYATSTTGGTPSSIDFLKIMGIYPRSNGLRCNAMPLTSVNPNCAWRSGDDGPFWVTNAVNITEPNGDNNTAQSMQYTFDSSGNVNWYNDITAGYDSPRFFCDVGDKWPETPRNCLEILQAGDSTGDGDYLIDPGLSGKPFKAYCDMKTDGGGWTLVGKGRQGWNWADAGQGLVSDIVSKDTAGVAYMPAHLVLHALGVPLNKSKDGLRIFRKEVGQEFRWKYTTATSFTWNFDGAPQAITHTMVGVNTVSGNTRDVQITGNDQSRIFTWAWSGHNNVRGFSQGAGNNGSLPGSVTTGWQYTTEAHAIPQTWVFVRE